MRSILYDVVSGEVFSNIFGWNESEASVRDDWNNFIYSRSGPLGEDKEMLTGRTVILVPLPVEPEILT